MKAKRRGEKVVVLAIYTGKMIFYEVLNISGIVLEGCPISNFEIPQRVFLITGSWESLILSKGEAFKGIK